MNSMIRTLLVDDEPLSVRGLWSVLETDDQVEIVGACDSGTDAVQAIERLLPDLVFLDIEMPGINGIEIARQISSRGSPLVVFVTAFEQHAIDAFTLQALDYVLKPFSDERLLASLTRAKVALEGGGPDKLGYSAARFGPKRAPQGGYLQRVLIHEAQRVRVVTTAEIEWISGAKNYIEVHTARGSFLCRQTIGEIPGSEAICPYPPFGDRGPRLRRNRREGGSPRAGSHSS